MKDIYPIGSKVLVNNVSGTIKDICLGMWVINDSKRTRTYHRYKLPLYTILLSSQLDEQYIKGEKNSLYVDDNSNLEFRLFPDEFTHVNFCGIEMNNVDYMEDYI